VGDGHTIQPTKSGPHPPRMVLQDPRQAGTCRVSLAGQRQTRRGAPFANHRDGGGGARIHPFTRGGSAGVKHGMWATTSLAHPNRGEGLISPGGRFGPGVNGGGYGDRGPSDNQPSQIQPGFRLNNRGETRDGDGEGFRQNCAGGEPGGTEGGQNQAKQEKRTG